MRDTEKDLQEAQDPATDKGRLFELKHHDDPRVRKAVIDNPGARNL